MHWQLLKMLLMNQLKGFILCLIGRLQEALSNQYFTLLQQRPQSVVISFMAACHLLGLLHHRQRTAQLPLQ